MDTEGEFRTWAESRREQLRRSAFLLSGDWFLADDLVQDAMSRMYAAWGRVSRQGDPDAYVRRVVVNLLIDERRRPWRRREVGRETLPERPAAATDTSDRAELVRALGTLAPRQRAVLVLRYFEDRSVDDVAAILGCTSGTVKSQTSKGLANLRTVLASVGLDADLITARESS